ncbi:MAG TPA: hypothetical protein VJJ82_00990 [Candidatus Nanoarchaeia archaeon]|nr:hypothetical protein [Candidatus Nanoarchaeia archaeon]
MTKKYGYADPKLVKPASLGKKATIAGFVIAFLFITAVWLALDQKLLFGKEWMSETYDNPDWRTNEGNLHTYGAWDLETHVWKTEYILEHFPNFNWNPYWYLGMPLFKYYQPGFYVLHALTILATGLTAAKSALLLIIFGHLLATVLTFMLCYKISRRIWASALSATFVLSNTFLSLRSYGWEPITVIFLFLYPLGLILFLKEPLRPFRLGLLAIMVVAYLAHPLLFFSLCMFMGLYLLSIAIRKDTSGEAQSRHYIWQYFALVGCCFLIGAVQFIPQVTYAQATSGAHMGVKYLPFYQVLPNIITLKDFFFDAGNLKGPGPIIMIGFFLLIYFVISELRNKAAFKSADRLGVKNHHIIGGLTIVLFMMVLFYYLEGWNVFPMNLLRSTQYHRIVPEFIITAAALVAALSTVAYSFRQKTVYYSMLVAFVLASGIIIHGVQGHWQTTDSIAEKPEFLYGDIKGRISFPYTDQSLAVRNSFTKVPQTYGYYEQGITNAFADELFSVSSGYHNAKLTVLHLKAANVGRLYVNTEEGERDQIVMRRLNGTLPFVYNNESRYSYFEVPLKDASLAQAIDGGQVTELQKKQPQCRSMFEEDYCGSQGEEFVSTDPNETAYLEGYVDLIEQDYHATAMETMDDPDHYRIRVQNAGNETMIVVKMTYDRDFEAVIDGVLIQIEKIGPDFMLLKPNREGDYVINLQYRLSKEFIVGGIISAASIFGVLLLFIIRKHARISVQFRRGDM